MKKRNCHNDIVWDHELGLPGIDVICDKYLHPEYHEVCVSLDDEDVYKRQLYGSQAANGVILITTKSGKAGMSRVTFSSNLTVDPVSYTHLPCLSIECKGHRIPKSPFQVSEQPAYFQFPKWH